MRRFVKALAFKRDKSDNHNSTSDPLPSSASDDGHIVTKKSRKPPHSLRIKSFISTSSSRSAVTSLLSSPSTPQLSVNGDAAPSSSASSSGSTDFNLQTPDDDRASLMPPSARDKAWNLWVVNKKSSPSTAKDKAVRELDRSLPRDWLDPPPQVSRSDSSRFLRQSFVSEAKSSVYDINDETLIGPEALMGHLDAAIPQSAQVTPAVARENMRVLIESKLVPNPVSYPLASSTGPLYPRSCNKSTDLPRKSSMRYDLLQKRLLRRVEETSFDAASLLPITTARRSVPQDPLPSLPPHDTAWPSKTLQVSSYSVGIRRWVARPCFEETHNVYFPSDEGIAVRQVSGSSFGVPALDYSEALDILADPGYYTSDTSATQTRAEVPIVTVVPPATQVNPDMTFSFQQPPSSSNMMSPSILVRNHVSAVPSPLRNDVLSSTSNEREESESPTIGISPTVNPVRRGVHFADDDDDALPLHIVRMKRKKEERAKFLRSEQRRREVETRQAQRQAEEERRRRELAQIEKERELQERRAQDEEQRQRIYLEEVAAARLRRETYKAGGLNGPMASSLSPTHVRDVEHSPKPRQDRYRRSSSSYDSPPVSRGASSSPGTAPHSASESSRPPSATRQPKSSLGDKNSATRPASMPSVHSSEDVHLRPQSRRNSAATSGSLRPMANRTSTYPMWPNNFFMPPAPLVPPYMPPYMMPLDPSLSMDMPLLPPAPPFMLQQYPRRSSRHSAHSNSSSSRVGTPADSSVDLSRSGYSLPPSPPSSRSSGLNAARRSRAFHTDPRRASMPISAVKSDQPETLPASQSQPQTSPRHPKGGSKPAQQQLPSPWTALPTKTGAAPAAMPRTR